jgi:NADPH2:quinone reductase
VVFCALKAIRVHEFGDPEVMRLEEVPDPQPGPRQVVVRVRAAGINPVDAYIRSGSYARKPELPYTPGSDAAGTVESVGQGVDAVQSGARVYTSGSVTGTYAELTLCELSQIHQLPENASFAQGAALGVPYATAARALLQRAKAVPGETVLVHGASGGVGIAAVQLARAQGMTVIGTGGSERGRQVVTEQGAQHVLDHHAPDYLHQVMEFTDGRGVDVVLEMLANVNLGKDLTLVARGGRIVVIGNRGTIEINPRDAMARDASILGMVLFNASRDELASIHALLGAGLKNGTLCPIIHQEIPLAEALRAHYAVIEEHSQGKIVLVP